MQRYIIPLLLLLSAYLPVVGQSDPLSIAHQVVSGDRDTVLIYYINNTSSAMEIGAVNLSLVYDGTEATLEGIVYSIFAEEWGIQARRSQVEPGSFTYGGNSYRHRWQYGNTSSDIFNPTTITLTQTNSQPTLAIKLVFDYTGAGTFAPYLENEVENFINQQGDAMANPIPWNRATLTAGTFPVEWLAFEATYAGDHTVALTWTTASESQNRSFQIERSENARDFVYLGEVAGAGNSVEAANYHFLDRQATGERYHYRLRQVDFDGGFSYSQIRQVRMDGSLSGSLLMYPNPAQTWARLEGLNTNEPVRVEILDLTGRSCRTLTTATNQAGSLDCQVSDLARGIYQVKVQELQSGGVFSRKLIVE